VAFGLARIIHEPASAWVGVRLTVVKQAGC
jgi:hypothetical protein